MLMRDSEILQAVKDGLICISPFREEKIQGASYDLSVGAEALVSNSDDKVLLGADRTGSLHLNAGDFALVITRESVKLPMDVACDIGPRSSLARRGLILLAGMQVDPGFEGHLRFGLFNASPRRITLDWDDELCMLEFHKLSGPVSHSPARNPDLIAGTIPEQDRIYLRQLETTSLSELARNLQSLSKSVETLTIETRTMAKGWKVVMAGIVAIFTAVVAAIIINLLK
jgi:deoxycytidine triphosphate deaminase